ncbi:beta-ketoacyl-acyl-carrier-protein synthase II [Orientia chuto str. Dubai]|uniref:3-oxoacyl-[acyl-carrier-protein] synthase 2 n=1 Tax=Orientia chuto str. Dubai TaxID=1359168 RepID=A0A0F3MI47_9RICK|nr:beta-ketoacyl-ACP synthase II [Candidatus Orientia mediorientalis]KJV55443.1 beta-ketoacyl-acyl-carrier-protein synthase II [Orientia chuto str. Dubai]
MNDRRVVITGIGMITPLGTNAKVSWQNLIKCESGITQIHRFDTSNLKCKIAGLVLYDDKLTIYSPRGDELLVDFTNKKHDLFIQYGIIAAQEAIEDSGIDLNINEEIKENIGVIIGTGMGGIQTIADNAISLYTGNKISTYFITSSLSNLISGHISVMYGFRGPNQSVTSSCATGAHAIIDAARMIKCNEANVMIAGGSEAIISDIAITGFNAIKALSTRYNDNPKAASRPWDRNRDGFVMSEGAGIVVIEELKHAKKRGAKIYAELSGYGLSSDAYHITCPHPDGIGAKAAMLKAIKNSKINIKDINYVNAHATSTKKGDLIELNAIKNLILKENYKTAISSTKSSTGHLLGASGSVEVIFTALTLKNQVIPATLNLDNPIEEAKDINLVPNIPQECKINYALSNSFGFGSTNVSIALTKFI